MMNVTLKKAAALATALSAHTVPLSTKLEVSIYSETDVEAQTQDAYNEFAENLTRSLAIAPVVYTRRTPSPSGCAG